MKKEVIGLAIWIIQIIHGYAIGMINYNETNDKNSTRQLLLLNLIPALFEELREYMHDLVNFRFMNAFLELNDVYHTIIVTLVMLFSPKFITNQVYIWYLVFFWSGILTPAKHGLRYLKYGCIRSLNNCKNNEHNCINNYLTRQIRSNQYS
jgi:hypothetical protein